MNRRYTSAGPRTGFEATMTPQQSQVLQAFKAKLKASEYSADIEQNPDGDRFLLRFLRATMKDKNRERVFDLDKAYERLQRTLEWRRKYKVDELRRLVETNSAMPAGYDEYHNDVRPSLDFVDPRTGRPVHFEKMGLLSQHLKVDRFTEDQWVTFFAIDCERSLLTMREESVKRNADISTMITIIDEEGTGFGIMSRLSFFKTMNVTAAEYYPEMLGSIFIVRAPWIFSAIFTTIKGLLDPDTASKILVSSGVATEALKDVIPAELIPKDLGGESEATIPVPIDARGAAT